MMVEKANKMTTKTVTPVSKTLEIAGRTLTLESGLVAEQASGAVTVRYGDTMLLVTAMGARAGWHHHGGLFLG
jgi:polyribonucleotide nucleotidyltransferase